MLKNQKIGGKTFVPDHIPTSCGFSLFIVWRLSINKTSFAWKFQLGEDIPIWKFSKCVNSEKECFNAKMWHHIYLDRNWSVKYIKLIPLKAPIEQMICIPPATFRKSLPVALYTSIYLLPRWCLCFLSAKSRLSLLSNLIRASPFLRPCWLKQSATPPLQKQQMCEVKVTL